MVMETMSQNVRQIAQRLSRTRTFSTDKKHRTKSGNDFKSDQIFNNNLYKRGYSKSVSIDQSGFYDDNFGIYPDKIRNWMSRSMDLLEIEDNEETKPNVFRMSSHSGSETESNNSGDRKLERKLSKSLKTVLLSTDSILYDVPWDVKKCDLFIRVENRLFPVEKNFVVYISDKFQQMLDDSVHGDVEDLHILELSEYTLDEVKTVLTFAYADKGVKITDENVASLLQLGDEFKVSRLIFQCEKHLRNSKTFNPLIMSHLAKQYDLKNLLEYAYCEISKIENVEETQEFQLLDASAQNQILKFLLVRYKKAAKTLSQFDVHLCSHHGNEPKSSSCCFRAATYSTEQERTFLVKMEKPSEKLIEKYNDVLHCDSLHLIQQLSIREQKRSIGCSETS